MNRVLKKERPVVSVGMTAYNHAAYLHEAIESILLQALPEPYDLHLVIGDDASTDESQALLRTLQTKHPDQITLLLQPVNVGLTNNLAAIKANLPKSTRYLALFSADDLMLPGKLMAQVNFLDNHPSHVMCYHDSWVWDQALNKKYRYNSLLYGQRAYQGEGVAQKLLEKGCFVSPISALLRHKATEHIQFLENLSMYNDWAYYIEVAYAGPVGYINKPFCTYRRHSSNLTRVSLDPKGPVKILEHFVKQHPKDAFSVQKGLVRHYIAFGWRYLLLRDWAQARAHGLALLRLLIKDVRLLVPFVYWNLVFIITRIGLVIKLGTVFK